MQITDETFETVWLALAARCSASAKLRERPKCIIQAHPDDVRAALTAALPIVWKEVIDLTVDFVLGHNEVVNCPDGGVLAPINPHDWRDKVSLTPKETAKLLPGSRTHFDERVAMWKLQAYHALMKP